MSPKIRRFYKILFPAILMFALLAAGAERAAAQNAPPPPKPEKENKTKTSPKPLKTPNLPRQFPKIFAPNPGASEKAIAVDANVNISLCVTGGNIKVNGWDRNEVRVFVNGGHSVGFKVLQKSKQTEKPVWIKILGFDPTDETASPEECLMGEEIEIDVPRKSAVNIKSQESKTVIESVGKVSIKNVVGDIFLNDIAQGIEATTYEGDIMVNRSGGAMSLQSGAGNVVVSGASPSEIGDILKAKTNNGAISLQDIEHRQLEINSNSGSIKFTGDLLSGGQYSFGTANGSILLTIPPDSSSKINASYGYGSFNSEIPLQKIQKSPVSRAQNLTAIMGSGDAALNFTTYNGSINIKKKTAD